MFFRKKAKEKIGPRVYRWAETMGLEFWEHKFWKLEKRWGKFWAEVLRYVPSLLKLRWVKDGGDGLVRVWDLSVLQYMQR